MEAAEDFFQFSKPDYSDDEGIRREVSDSDRSYRSFASEEDIPYIGEEELPEFGAFERTSRGTQTQMISQTAYLLTRSEKDRAMQEIRKSLSNYIENDDRLYKKIEDRLSQLDNLEFYNPELLVLASLFDKDYPQLSKISLSTFSKDLEVSKEDLVRYIRMFKKEEKIYEDSSDVSFSSS